MKKACIFDLDGTLTNTIETLAYFVNQTLKNHGIKKIEVDKFKYLAGDGARNLIKRSLACNLEKWDKTFEDKILQEYNFAYDNNFTHLCKVYDGVPELLKDLKQKRIKLAVCTNKPQSTATKTVNKFFGDATFELIFGQRENFPIKPDPSACIEIIKKLSVTTDDCLYIGDTATDMKTGKNANFFTIGVLWGFRQKEELEASGADAIVTKPSEILQFL